MDIDINNTKGDRVSDFEIHHGHVLDTLSGMPILKESF